MTVQLTCILGLTFGLLAAACAYVISYGEYKRNWSFRGNAATAALRPAGVAFVYFFLGSLAVGAALMALL
jgi:hypothetical protein